MSDSLKLDTPAENITYRSACAIKGATLSLVIAFVALLWTCWIKGTPPTHGLPRIETGYPVVELNGVRR